MPLLSLKSTIDLDHDHLTHSMITRNVDCKGDYETNQPELEVKQEI